MGYGVFRRAPHRTITEVLRRNRLIAAKFFTTVQAYRFTSARFRLAAGNFANVAARLRVSAAHTVDLASRFIVQASRQITTSTSASATQYASTAKVLFAADGTAIVLYFDGTGISFVTSSSPYTSWSSATVLRSTSQAVVAAIIDTSDNVHVVLKDTVSTLPNALYYKLTKSGTTWTAGAVQSIDSTLHAGGSAEAWRLYQDPTGRIWAIGFAFVSPNYLYYAYYGTDSGTNGVTSWTQSLAFTSANTATNALSWNAGITGNYLVLVYSQAGTSYYKRLDTSGTLTSWTVETSIGATGIWQDHQSGAFLADGSGRLFYTSQPGTSNDYAIRTLYYTPSTDTWSATNDIGTNTTDRYPTLVNFKGNLYCYWCEYGGAASNFAIVHRVWSNASGTWGAKVTDEPSGYNRTHVVAGKYDGQAVAWIWTEGTSSPYSVRFDYTQLATLSWRSTASRFRLLGQSWRFASARFALVGSNWRFTSSRFNLISPVTWRVASTRFVLRATQWAFVSTRYRVQSATQWRVSATRYALQAVAYRFTQTRFNLISAGNYRLAQTRLALRSANTWRDLAARFKIGQAVTPRDLTTRVRVRALTYVHTALRASVRAQAWASVQSRLRVMSAATWHDGALRARLAALAYVNVPGRFRLFAQPTIDVASRLKIRSALTWRTSSTRYRVQVVNTRDTTALARLMAWVTRDTQSRYRLRSIVVYRDTPTRLIVQSGGYRLTQSRSRFKSNFVWVNTPARVSVRSLAWQFVASRIRISTANVVSERTRFALRSPALWIFETIRFRLRSGILYRDSAARARVSIQSRVYEQTRYSLRAQAYRNTTVLFNIGNVGRTFNPTRYRLIARAFVFVSGRFGLKSPPTNKDVATLFKVRVYTGPEGQLTAPSAQSRRYVTNPHGARTTVQPNDIRKAVAI